MKLWLPTPYGRSVVLGKHTRRLVAPSAALALVIVVGAAPSALADAQFSVTAVGPSSLPVGLSGTYIVTVLNDGDAAPVQMFIVFAGRLQPTGQIVADGGFDCAVAAEVVRCTVPKLPPHAPTNIVVQGRGSEAGAGQLVVNVNPDRSVPENTPLGGGNDNVAQKNVTIT